MAVSNQQTIRLRIEAINIIFNNPQSYPVNLKLLADSFLICNLESIRPGQPLRLDRIKPFDVNSGSSIELRVYETRKLGAVRSRVASVVFPADTPEITIVREIATPVPLSITFILATAAESAQAPRIAQQNAMNMVHNFPIVLNGLGRARGAVESILALGGVVAELNTILKPTLDLFTKAWETLKRQEQCDIIAADLIIGLGDLLPIIEVVPKRARAERLKGTIIDILRLTEDASNFVLEYRSDGTAVQALRAFATSNARDQVDEFLKELSRLKEKFDREVVIMVAETTETLLTDADQTLITKLIVSGVDYDPPPECLDGTREAILGEITQWAIANDDSGSLFWLYGLAGSGKSTIAASVCRRLRDASCLGGSFFCKRDDSQLRNAKNVVSTISARLARSCKPYGVRLVDALREDSNLTDSEVVIRFKGLLIDPLQAMGTDIPEKPMVIVIDALDECGDMDSRKQLLSSLLRLTELISWIKVFLTSRPNEEIRELIAHSDRSRVRSRDLFQEEQAVVLRDISLFVRERMQSVASKTGRSGWPDDVVVYELSDRASGLFIWAQTACKFITGGLDPKARLKQVLAGERSLDSATQLSKLYLTALSESFEDADDNAQIVQRCVGAVILTGNRTPLPDFALGALLDHFVDLDVLRGVIECLGSVLYRDKDGAVRVLHQSFSDFMVDQKHCPDSYRVNVSQQNGELTLSCLQIMSRELKFNMCDLESSYSFNGDIQDLPHRVEDKITPHLTYSCINWISHLIEGWDYLCKGGTRGQPNILDAVERLILWPTLLHWIEALSLLGQLKVVLSSLQQLSRRLETHHHQFWKWAKDLYRFIFAFYDPITRSTPHLYISALPLGAANYEIMRSLKSFYPDTLAIMQGEHLLSSPCLHVIPHPQSVNTLAVSSDGRYIASGSEDHTVRLWDAETGAPITEPLLGHSNLITCIAFSPDNKRIISGSEDETIRVWNLGDICQTFKPLLGHKDWIKFLAFFPNGRRIASVSYDQTIRIWDAESYVQISMLNIDQFGLSSSLGFCLDGEGIILTSVRGTILTWMVETNDTSSRTLQEFPVLYSMCAAISSNGLKVVAGTDEGKIYLWDLQTGVLLLGPLIGHSGSIKCIAFSLDDRYIASGSEDKEIRVWDALTGVEVSEPLQGHASEVTSVVFFPSLQRVVSGSSDETARIWEVSEREEPSRWLKFHAEAVHCVAVSPSGKHIASGSEDRTVGLWDIETGAAVLERLRGYSSRVTSIAFSPDGSRIGTGSEDCTIRAWDVLTGAELFEPIRGHDDWVNCIDFSPDGSLIVSASEDTTIRLWDAKNGVSTMSPLQGHKDSVSSVAFSPDGCYICSGSRSSSIRIWDAATGINLREINPDHSCSINCVRFSPDGQHIASGGTDDAVSTWDVKTGVQVLGSLQGHTDSVMGLAFSPSGKYIISGSLDSTIRIWDAETGAAVSSPLYGHRSHVLSVAVSYDGSKIVSGSRDGTIRIWDRNLNNLAPEQPSAHGNFASSETSSYKKDNQPLDLGNDKQLLDPNRSTIHSWELFDQLDPQGWVRSPRGEPLLWIPQEYQRRYRDQARVVLSSRASDYPVVFDFSNFTKGTAWASVHN